MLSLIIYETNKLCVVRPNFQKKISHSAWRTWSHLYTQQCERGVKWVMSVLCCLRGPAAHTYCRSSPSRECELAAGSIMLISTVTTWLHLWKYTHHENGCWVPTDNVIIEWVSETHSIRLSVAYLQCMLLALGPVHYFQHTGPQHSVQESRAAAAFTWGVAWVQLMEITL